MEILIVPLFVQPVQVSIEKDIATLPVMDHVNIS